MDARQQSSLWIRIGFLVLVCLFFVQNATLARKIVVIGGTEPQRRFISCVAEAAAGELRGLPSSAEPVTFVILEHQKFLQAREAFHARGARLAFSSLTSGRVYLSSRVFLNSDTAMWCVPHELGHFATHSIFEGNAELAAERIRWSTQRICGPGPQ